MDATHRKIELQSPSDLAYLTSRLRTAARLKLDLHLPPVSDTSEPDELRKNVEILVDQFVASILAGMKSNISINGMDVIANTRSDENGMQVVREGGEGVAGVEEEEYEVFDEKARARLAAAVGKRDALVAKISSQRRGAAQIAAKKWQEGFERENEALAAEEKRTVELVQQGGEQDGLSVEVKREDEVRRNWERALKGLQRLNGGLPETRARLERSGDVVGYLGGEAR